MNEPDYCDQCNLYTMQKQEPEPDETEDVWYCPMCNQYKVRNTNDSMNDNKPEG